MLRAVNEGEGLWFASTLPQRCRYIGVTSNEKEPETSFAGIRVTVLRCAPNIYEAVLGSAARGNILRRKYFAQVDGGGSRGRTNISRVRDGPERVQAWVVEVYGPDHQAAKTFAIGVVDLELEGSRVVV